MSTSAPTNGATKQSKQVPLLAVLLALALGAVIFSWRASQPATVRTTPSTDASAPETRAATDLDQLTASVRQHIQEASTPLDVSQWQTKVAPPPEPVAAEAAPASSGSRTLRLKGIARQGDQAVAFIDDHTVAVGESIAGHRILEVGDEHAVLAGPDGERITLRLYETR